MHLKTNPFLIEAINVSRKNKSLLVLAKKLAGSTRKQSSLNLSEIDSKSKDGETIVLQNNSISLSNIVSLQVPGHISERQPAEKNPVAIVEKDLERQIIEGKYKNIIAKIVRDFSRMTMVFTE